MKKILFLLLLFFPIISNAQNEIVERFFDNLNKKTLESDLLITVTENANQPTNITGKIIMLGNKFKAEIMGMEVAFDGKTLYTYSEDMDELTLSNPMQEELIDINPVVTAKEIVSSCNVTTKEQGDNYVITLIPKEQGSGIKDFVVTFRKSDLMPISIVIRETTMQTTKAVFRNAKFISIVPDFTISKPGAYINDLR